MKAGKAHRVDAYQLLACKLVEFWLSCKQYVVKSHANELTQVCVSRIEWHGWMVNHHHPRVKIKKKFPSLLLFTLSHIHTMSNLQFGMSSDMAHVPVSNNSVQFLT